jgi:hypothetical protein
MWRINAVGGLKISTKHQQRKSQEITINEPHRRGWDYQDPVGVPCGHMIYLLALAQLADLHDITGEETY